MQSDCHCGSSFLLALPDDVFSIVAKSLSPKDLCSLGLCCWSLHDVADSDKLWLTQCEVMGVVPLQDLVEWRKGVSSYKSLCRFLISVEPLIGIWVHQNPELGNVVYVMPGFISVVGCRIIPQELGPLGIEDGPILWAPVFEIIGNFDGSASFFLHGRERENDYLYPGSLKPIDRTCNALLLEIEPRDKRHGGKLVHSKSFELHQEQSRKICRSDGGISKSQRISRQVSSMVPFSRLSFGDRRKLLEIVTSQVRQKVPDLAYGLLFPRLRGDDDEDFQEDMAVLRSRRSLLMEMYKLGGGHVDVKGSSEPPPDPTQLELSDIRKRMGHLGGFSNSLSGDDSSTQYTKRKTLGGYFRDSLNQILGKSSSIKHRCEILKSGSSTGSENKHARLHEFLRSGDTVGLSLHAATIKLSSYRAWPNMHDSRFALYKLPLRPPTVGQEYAGLWGGTFGWPPGRPTEDKPGKALFFLLLSYEESSGQRLLIATKILEGTHYVLHPNGSAMFLVNIDEPSLDHFPWDVDGESLPIDVQHAFMGEGIANGYGFRYPGSKPGSLFVLQDELLAFIWKESRAVLTLHRLDLQNLLKKGERVPALPPISNFSYLTKSYSNVFAGFSNTSNCQSSPRIH